MDIDKKEKIKNIEMYLLDMDGTIYIDDKLIDGTKEFLRKLEDEGKKYVFVTNNSSKSVDEYIKKLNKLGIKASYDNIFTSAQATSLFLKSVNPQAKLYVVGTESLKKDLKANGFFIPYDVNEKIDFLVVGYDTELNYQKLKDACFLLNKGVKFIATNPDVVCPIENNQFIPDCGSICNMLEKSTNKKPFYIGKPRKEMVEVIAQKYNIELDKIAVVGDRLYTDIACGINAGVTSMCVLTGETTKEEVEKSNYKPTYVFDSIKNIFEILNT